MHQARLLRITRRAQETTAHLIQPQHPRTIQGLNHLLNEKYDLVSSIIDYRSTGRPFTSRFLRSHYLASSDDENEEESSSKKPDTHSAVEKVDCETQNGKELSFLEVFLLRKWPFSTV
jgi:hypothetical protein